MCPETELLLFTAARAQLVREIIAPALIAGKIVLSDRFLDSSTVYQGIGRNLALDPVNQINRFAVGNVMPDVTIVIDVPSEVGLARIRQRATDLPDRMERENLNFYKKVREGYLVLAKGLPERFVVVDGTLNESALEKKIWAAIAERVAGLNHNGTHAK
jgi:dTMP kinase